MATPAVSATDRVPHWTVRSRFHDLLAIVILALMAALAGGAALRESVTFDEVAHIGAGVSYWQRLDLRMNEEHPPLAKLLAALPLIARGVRTDYSNPSWSNSTSFFSAFMGQWIFGEYVLNQWNDPPHVLEWARFPMLLLALALGWCLYVYGARIGGPWGGMLAVLCYATAPVFLAFGPLVLTDIAITLFSLVSLWRFAELWKTPSRKNTLLFALSFAGALLSKFSAGLLFFAFVAVGLSTRWRSVSGQPEDKTAAHLWRKARWRAMFIGTLWAAVVVYVVYFVFSWRQATDSLSFLGGNAASLLLRRVLMPPWLYLRGLFLVVVTGSRPAFLLGHSHPHGVWYFFPVLFLLKSPVGFLGLMMLAGVLAVRWKRLAPRAESIIPSEFRMHWRVLWVSLVVFSGACILSHFNVSFRHFSIPLALLMLALASMPTLLQRFRQSNPKIAVAAVALTVVLVISCVVDVVRQYPYFFPFINTLSFGRPAYALVSDSNLDWNQSLPDVQHFAQEHAIDKLKIDEYAITLSSAVVPNSELWDCQQPSDEDAGRWVVVSANFIVDTHHCTWLMQYPHQALAGGSMYAVKLPLPIPAEGTAGGPPLPADRHMLFQFYREPRIMFQEVIRDPSKLPAITQEAMAAFQQQAEERRRKH